MLESLFNTVARLQASNFIKKRPTLVFLCEICETFKNTYFEEYLGATASVVSFSCHMCWSLFLVKLHVFRPVTLLKRDQHWYFSVKFAKRLRTPILKNIWERLLLQFLSHGRMCIITSKIYQPKIECKDRGSIFRRIKNKDRWK